MMMHVDWIVSLLQFLIAFISVIGLAYCLVYALKKTPSTPHREAGGNPSKQAVDYVRKLSVSDYESYHKYEIWRYYLFS